MFAQIEQAETGGAELQGKSWSGHPCTARMPDNRHEMISSNRQVTTVELCFILSISVIAIIEVLGCSKVCACWVSLMLPYGHICITKAIVTVILHH
jgi:hypothetical protein